MGVIRQFLPEDIPAVTALRARAFAHSTHATAHELSAYFERIFFGTPWRTGALHSLVYVDDDAHVTGFLGVIPRRAVFCGQPIDVAVCTQFMVDPASRGLAGVRLVKTVLSGRQDLTFADVANDTSRAMWEGLRGSVSAIHSLTWSQHIREAPFSARTRRRGLLARALSRAIRPALAFTGGPPPERWKAAPGTATVPLTAELIAAQIDAVLEEVSLHPLYDATSTQWLLDELAARRGCGRLGGAAVRDSRAGVIGWFLYYMNGGGTGDVVQVVAARDRYAEVLRALFRDAWKRGVAAVTGRGDAGLITALDPRYSRVSRSGSWALVHSRRREIIEAITRGDAFFSRLDGEWWMTF
jgi:hypothetical protein